MEMQKEDKGNKTAFYIFIGTMGFSIVALIVYLLIVAIF